MHYTISFEVDLPALLGFVENNIYLCLLCPGEQELTGVVLRCADQQEEAGSG